MCFKELVLGGKSRAVEENEHWAFRIGFSSLQRSMKHLQPSANNCTDQNSFNEANSCWDCKNPSLIYRSWHFITVFTRFRHWSLYTDRLIQSMRQHPSHLGFFSQFSLLLLLVFTRCLFLNVLEKKCSLLYSVFDMLHFSLIKSSRIYIGHNI